MRLYDLRATIGIQGEPQRLWDARHHNYDETGAYINPIAKRLWFTAPYSNSGYMVVGGKLVNAALATRQGLPDLAPGQSFCWPLENVDLREVWYDGTVAGDALACAWEAEPSTERVS